MKHYTNPIQIVLYAKPKKRLSPCHESQTIIVFPFLFWGLRSRTKTWFRAHAVKSHYCNSPSLRNLKVQVPCVWGPYHSFTNVLEKEYILRFTYCQCVLIIQPNHFYLVALKASFVLFTCVICNAKKLYSWNIERNISARGIRLVNPRFPFHLQ